MIDENARLIARLAVLTAKGAPTIPPAPPGRSPAEEADYTAIPHRQLEIAALVGRLTTLLAIANRPARQTEYQNMATRVREFNLTTAIPDMTSDTLTVVPNLMIP